MVCRSPAPASSTLRTVSCTAAIRVTRDAESPPETVRTHLQTGQMAGFSEAPGQARGGRA
jgi:hypothetical protein